MRPGTLAARGDALNVNSTVGDNGGHFFPTFSGVLFFSSLLKFILIAAEKSQTRKIFMAKKGMCGDLKNLRPLEKSFRRDLSKSIRGESSGSSPVSARGVG